MSIRLENVSHIYGRKTPNEHLALKNINLEINEGEFVGIIGHTGSGKSTLVQLLNGLLQPTEGTVYVDGTDLSCKSKEAVAARRRVGMVFQYPEYQLFEETVADDIAFGPKNYGLSEAEVTERVKEAMDFVGLDYETYGKRSPFRLSGGQMRRVAIAGIIAMRPRYLILDEPSAGLDPVGRREIFGQIERRYKETGITVVLVSHNMEDIAALANRLIILNRGEIAADGVPTEIFATERDVLRAAGVDVPPVTHVLQYLKGRGLDVETRVKTVSDGTDTIYRALRRNGHVD